MVRRPSLAKLCSFVAVAGACLFIFIQLKPGLLFTSTTPAGGDMGAHVWAPNYLQHHLLPHGRLWGWAPDWYAGFPAFTFYFPLPSLLIVLLNVALPYGIAFKLVTVLGLIALPVCAYAFGKMIGLRGAAPACIAVLTVPFVFDRSYTIYGGNIASTLAGEFSFSISLAVALLFLGVFARGLRTGRQGGLAAALLAITGLCHFIPTFFAIGGALLLLVMHFDRRRLRYAVPVGVTAGFLGACWWLPFFMRLPYTTDMGWEPLRTFHKALLTHSLGIPLILAALGAATSLVLRRRPGIFLTLLAAGSALAFVFMPAGRLWNARVLPFWFVSVYLLAGLGVAVIGEAVAAVAAYWQRGGPDEGRELLPVDLDGEIAPAFDAGLQSVRAYVLARCPTLPAGSLSVDDALGSVVARAVTAAEPVPPFANSAMDGFAVRAADVVSVPVELRVVAAIAAGADPSAIDVGPGQAARIMTGAPMPAGADAVVMIEETDGGLGDQVTIRRSVRAGDFVRAAGEDVRPGDVVVAEGEVLTPARLGLLAAVGCRRVTAVPVPRVGVLSTGDELAPAGAELRHGQIHDSNVVLLRGLVSAAGCQPVVLGAVSDDPTSITAALRDAATRCDAIITSGGVSVGDYDFLADALGELGEARTFRLPIKPAKPFVFGRIGAVPVFALPGNPVSAAVSFELLARPALRQLAGYGADQLDRPAVIAVADEPLERKADGKTHYVRVATRWDDDGRVHVRSSGGQGSHVLSGLAAAGGLAVLPDGLGVRSGAEVRVLLFDVPTLAPAANGHVAAIERNGDGAVPGFEELELGEPDGFAIDVAITPAERALRAITPVVALAVFLTVVAMPLHVLPKWSPFKTTDSSFVPGWVKWNYEGYERKTAYPEYRDVIAMMRRASQEHGCGRSSWEYESELDRFGTPMALMLLPYWTKGCVGSMEGLYFESSATTPYHFLSNSALSLRPPRPQRDLPYRDLNVTLGVQHLQLLGVRYYITLSEAAQSQAKADPDLTLIGESKPWTNTVTDPGQPATAKTRRWQVYLVRNSAQVAPLQYEPVVMKGVPKGGKVWQNNAVNWFNSDQSVWQVPLAASGPKQWARVQGAPTDAPHRAVPKATVSHIKTTDDRISFDVDRVGTPVLVKASYFPNWQAKGAKGPWRVTPNQMVVIPTSKHVTLHYGSTPVDRAGWAMTVLGLIGVVALTRRRIDTGDDDEAEVAEVSAGVPLLAPELEPEAPQPVH